MTSSLALPDWLPWWLVPLIMVPVLLYLVVFLLMPFSVFGVKGRLAVIDARLDELQGEIRALTLRLPERAGRGAAAEVPPVPPAPSPLAMPDPPRRAAPPRIEEADWDDPPPERRRPRGAGPRAEPRLDWPR